MADDKLAQLAINTIRTLSMDAVQQANSGHPGTPMALAPLVYTLWNRVLRFDPQDPIWPNRDRFVLSNGHASMLLWSLLHLTKTQAVNADYEQAGSARGLARRHPPLPPARQQGPRSPRISLDLGRGDHDRSARPGRGDQRRHGDRREVARRSLQPARLRGLRLRRLRGLRRRLHDGGRRRGSGVARRAPGSGQPLLDLRQQPHHDRGQYADHLHRGRRGPVPRLRMERAARRRRQRRRAHRACPGRFPRRRPGRPTFIVLDTPHRLRRHPTSRTRPRPTASRSAKRRFDSPSASTVGPRTPNSSCPTASTSTSPVGSGRAAPRRGRCGPNSSPRIGPSIRSSPPRSSRCSGASCRPVGTAISPSFPPTRKAWPDGTPRARCSTCSPRTSPGSSAARRISGLRTRPP